MEMIAGATVIVRFTDLCCAGTLLSATAKESASEFVAAVGVPAITPLEGVNDKPAGNVPVATDQVNGAVPPVAVNFAE